MSKAFVFPGQGSQYPGMCRDLYDSFAEARSLCNRANEVLGFDLTAVMFEGSAEDLRQTRVTQPAVFLHSVVSQCLMTTERPAMVAGHSLGEFSALVACGALSFEDGLQLVSRRAQAMQLACELNEGTMAAVLSLADDRVEELCRQTTEGVVVAANYNCPGQIVISGSIEGVEAASVRLKEAGARRVLRLPVGGAFHSPLMEPAAEALREAIMRTEFYKPHCPIYQNVTAKAEVEPEKIRENLLAQLTAPVRWTQSVQQMINDGASEFYEFGPGDVLKGLIRKIDSSVFVG